jgi:predicted amidohydrolase YtcJ
LRYVLCQVHSLEQCAVARVGAVGVEERQVLNIDKSHIALPVGPVECLKHRIHFAGGGVIDRSPVGVTLRPGQPFWLYLDGPAVKDVFGPERMQYFQPLRALFDAGIVVGGGSDHMIRFDPREATNPYHPFLGMWIAITRKTVDGTVVNPEQRISRMEALKMWTWNGAYLMFAEKEKGSIEPGKLADLAMISKDYATCPENEIKDIEALRTVVGGKVVYDRLR